MEQHQNSIVGQLAFRDPYITHLQQVVLLVHRHLARVTPHLLAAKVAVSTFV